MVESAVPDGSTRDDPTWQLRIALCLGHRDAREWCVRLPQGNTLAAIWPAIVEALTQQLAQTQPAATPLSDTMQTVVALLQAIPEQGFSACGLWGRRCHAQTVFRAGDRLEIYRPLFITPEQARQRRFSQQGARSAGLFAARRPGAKAGY